MARSKTGIEEVKTEFEKVKHLLSSEVKVLPMAEDETQCVVVLNGSCETYKCSALTKHLRFLSRMTKLQAISL